MISSLIRLDLALLRSSRAFWLLFVFLIMAATFALIAGLDWRTRYVNAAQVAREQAAEAHNMLAKVYEDLASGRQEPSDVDNYDGASPFIPDPRDPYVAGFYHEQLAELPPGNLLGLATGSTELRSTHHTIRSVPVATLIRIGEPAERINPGALAAGRFDLLAFIIYLCPLTLAILLFDAVAREREGGQAALLAGLGLRQKELLLARGLTRGSIVLLMALIASIIGLALLGQLMSIAGLIWLGGTSIYLLFWTALLLGVARLGYGLIGSAAIAFTIWLVLLLVMPGLMERALRPSGLLEPRIMADAEVRKVEREVSVDEASRAAAKALVARKYWQVDFDEVPTCANREGIVSEYVVRRLSDEIYTAAMRTGREREQIYEDRLDRWSWLVPTLAFRRSMELVAGVSPIRQRAFEAQAIDYHAQWRNRVTDALFTCYQFTRSDFENAPQFKWNEPLVSSMPWGVMSFLVVFTLLIGRYVLSPYPLFQ